MKFFKSISLVVLLAAICLPNIAGAQDYEDKRKEIVNKQKDTRAEINVLEKRIRTYQQRINETEKRYDEIYGRYQNLNKLISLQDEKIERLTEEQNQINDELVLIQSEIEEQEEELKRLIDNYKKILTFAYKSGRSSNIELLLTSNSINQMLVRAKYLQKFEEQRSKQAQLIKKKKNELERNKKQLEEIRQKNQAVLNEIRNEKQELARQQQTQQKNVTLLRQDRENLLKQLRESREQRENLENTLNELFAAEEQLREAELERLRKLAEAKKITNADERAAEVAKYSTPLAGENLVDSETLLEFSQAFEQSRGNLPWPVSGTVSERFGRVRHPVYGTVTNNPGIEIVTNPASDVKVVQDGYVTNILPIRGYGETVIVSHGNFYTVYGNLSRINVRKNQLLKKGDIIGSSGTQISEMGETLFFMVRKGKTTLNPEDWLTAR